MGNDRDIKMSILEEIMELMDGQTFSKLKKPGAVEMSSIEVEPAAGEGAPAALAESAEDLVGDDEASELMKMYEEELG